MRKIYDELLKVELLRERGEAIAKARSLIAGWSDGSQSLVCSIFSVPKYVKLTRMDWPLNTGVSTSVEREKRKKCVDNVPNNMKYLMSDDEECINNPKKSFSGRVTSRGLLKECRGR